MLNFSKSGLRKKLRFKNDGTFKILQFADLHWLSPRDEIDDCDRKTKSVMEALIKYEKPDLVVYTGDLITSERTNPLNLAKTQDELEQTLWPLFEAAINADIPWTMIPGNHDHCHNIEKTKLVKALSQLPMSLIKPTNFKYRDFRDDSFAILGSMDEKDKWILYFIDSGCKYDLPVRTYAWITRDKINWYSRQADKYRKKNRTILPALAFFHIPIPEFIEVWETRPCFGMNNDGVSCPKINTGFYSAAIEKGDIKGMFVGHDHGNDYRGNLYGIELCYGRTTGYRMHQDNKISLGARVILLLEDESYFKTWVRLENGKIDKPTLNIPDGYDASDIDIFNMDYMAAKNYMDV